MIQTMFHGPRSGTAHPGRTAVAPAATVPRKSLRVVAIFRSEPHLSGGSETVPAPALPGAGQPRGKPLPRYGFRILYRNVNCSRMSCPRYSLGNGGNGFEALIPATAARSSGEVPELLAITSFGTLPLRATEN